MGDASLFGRLSARNGRRIRIAELVERGLAAFRHGMCFGERPVQEKETWAPRQENATVRATLAGRRRTVSPPGIVFCGFSLEGAASTHGRTPFQRVLGIQRSKRLQKSIIGIRVGLLWQSLWIVLIVGWPALLAATDCHRTARGDFLKLSNSPFLPLSTPEFLLTRVSLINCSD